MVQRWLEWAQGTARWLVVSALVSGGALTVGQGCLWQGADVPLGSDVRLTLLHTSDIHSRLFPFDLAPLATDVSLGLHAANAPFGGAARLGYLVQRERARAQRVIHLDSGDCFQGAPIFNQHEGEPEIRYQSAVGLDAAVIGNHEFDAGVDNLAVQLERWARFDVLAANYTFPDPDDPNANILSRVAQPFSLYNLKGLRVAVIGMANLGSLTSIVEGGNSLGITPVEQNETVRRYVQLLHGSVDLVVVLTHLGLTEDEHLITGYENVVWSERVHPNWRVIEDLGDGRQRVWVPGVRNVDVILGGHLHTVLNPPKVLTDPDGRKVVLAHSGAFAKYLGRLDLVATPDRVLGGMRIASHKYQIFPVDNRLAGREDAAIQDLLEPYRLDLNQALDLRKVIGYAPRAILRRGQGEDGDSPLGNIVAESMRRRRRVEAEFAFTNTLGIRDNFYAGPISLEDMFNVFPFENTLTVMYVSGREVQELIDYNTARSASRGCQAQAQVAGISFTMNCGQVVHNERDPANYSSPGKDIFVNGRALNPNAVYKMATNNYLAWGGSGFRVLKRNTTKTDTGISMRDALIDYLKALPTCREFEAENGFCDQPDPISQSICQEIGGPGRIAGAPAARGPYADVPCVVGESDGRIKRVTASAGGQ